MLGARRHRNKDERMERDEVCWRRITQNTLRIEYEKLFTSYASVFGDLEVKDDC